MLEGTSKQGDSNAKGEPEKKAINFSRSEYHRKMREYHQQQSEKSGEVDRETRDAIGDFAKKFDCFLQADDKLKQAESVHAYISGSYKIEKWLEYLPLREKFEAEKDQTARRNLVEKVEKSIKDFEEVREISDIISYKGDYEQMFKVSEGNLKKARKDYIDAYNSAIQAEKEVLLCRINDLKRYSNDIAYLREGVQIIKDARLKEHHDGSTVAELEGSVERVSSLKKDLEAKKDECKSFNERMRKIDTNQMIKDRDNFATKYAFNSFSGTHGENIPMDFNLKDENDFDEIKALEKRLAKEYQELYELYNGRRIIFDEKRSTVSKENLGRRRENKVLNELETLSDNIMDAWDESIVTAMRQLSLLKRIFRNGIISISWGRLA